MSDNPLHKISMLPPREHESLHHSLRRLIDLSLRLETVPADLGERIDGVRTQIDALCEVLEPKALSDGFPRMGRDTEPDGRRPYYVESPFVGDHNATIAPVKVEYVDGVTRGTVTYGVAYEGPPSCVHGGTVAQLFDQLLGYQNWAAGLPAPTASLTIHYRKMTPLFEELNFKAWRERRDGRKLYICGELRHKNELLAEAEALFIVSASVADS
ncbi:MAG: PaaI family thioesterase [Polyangiaceae bacterium]|nr:PaaI family thioesterase [Polyangiaceae bacterium]